MSQSLLSRRGAKNANGNNPKVLEDRLQNSYSKHSTKILTNDDQSTNQKNYEKYAPKFYSKSKIQELMQSFQLEQDKILVCLKSDIDRLLNSLKSEQDNLLVSMKKDLDKLSYSLKREQSSSNLKPEKVIANYSKIQQELRDRFVSEVLMRIKGILNYTNSNSLEDRIIKEQFSE